MISGAQHIAPASQARIAQIAARLLGAGSDLHHLLSIGANGAAREHLRRLSRDDRAPPFWLSSPSCAWRRRTGWTPS